MFLDLGTHATVPDLPGLADAQPMTHVELLDLDRIPGPLIVIGGYVGLGLAQAMRRFGSKVTVIEEGNQLVGREDPDVGAEMLDLFRQEEIAVRLQTTVRRVEGRSGVAVRIRSEGPEGEEVVDGTDLLVGAGRTPNTKGVGLEHAGVKLTRGGS
jgi:pyruvate/2-oxoglutarate dehydrogenase complex dihydrolipoamide dehydrogenase (E3) component